MSAQFDLLDTALARRSDPQSSQLAAAATRETGRRASDAQLLLGHIRYRPGLTSMEYAQRMIDTGMNWHRAFSVASRRMHDLAQSGYIRSTGSRVCTVTGRIARTWISTGETHESLRPF